MRLSRVVFGLCLASTTALLLPDSRQWFFLHQLRGLYLFAIASTLSYLGTPVARCVAVRLNAIDHPGGRKRHASPTPVLGGIAVFGAFAVVVVLNFYFSLEMKAIAAGGALIFLLGLVDDLRELPSSLKLTVQLTAVAILIRYGVVVSFFPLDTYWGTALSWILTAVWMIGITNAVNCLDGLDGLATGMTIIICLFYSLVALRTDQTFMAFLSLALAGGCLGFLPYNFRPGRSASIFLGDAGSTSLGFILAGIGLMGEWGDDNAVGLAVPVILLGVPIFDMTFTTVTRVMEGKVKGIAEWLAYAGRDHFHHRLLDIGLGRAGSVLIIWTVTVLSGLTALLLRNARGVEAVFALLQSAIIFVLMAFFMTFVRHRYVQSATWEDCDSVHCVPAGTGKEKS